MPSSILLPFRSSVVVRRRHLGRRGTYRGPGRVWMTQSRRPPTGRLRQFNKRLLPNSCQVLSGVTPSPSRPWAAHGLRGQMGGSVRWPPGRQAASLLPSTQVLSSSDSSDRLMSKVAGDHGRIILVMLVTRECCLLGTANDSRTASWKGRQADYPPTPLPSRAT